MATLNSGSPYWSHLFIAVLGLVIAVCPPVKTRDRAR